MSSTFPWPLRGSHTDCHVAQVNSRTGVTGGSGATEADCAAASRPPTTAAFTAGLNNSQRLCTQCRSQLHMSGDHYN